MHNVPFGVAVARVAGGECHNPLGGALPGMPGHGFDDVHLVGLHDFLFVHGVRVVAVFGAHINVVTVLEQVNIVEHFTAGLAVPGE